jgi:hypothetical protein
VLLLLEFPSRIFLMELLHEVEAGEGSRPDSGQAGFQK